MNQNITVHILRNRKGNLIAKVFTGTSLKKEDAIKVICRINKKIPDATLMIIEVGRN